jgi:hypothetical protein
MGENSQVTVTVSTHQETFSLCINERRGKKPSNMNSAAKVKLHSRKDNLPAARSFASRLLHAAVAVSYSYSFYASRNILLFLLLSVPISAAID